MPTWRSPTYNDGARPAYFTNLEQLDVWSKSAHKNIDTILYIPRADPSPNGRLLVCHDYKGGYKEDPQGLSYTFPWWDQCDVFVYFAHHRVTIPPPGWINAAHRQGVKIYGTLIFEGGAESDCLRLLVGKLPSNPSSSSSPSPTTLPISPHYARLLAKLAHQRGFDGYLLNFECPLIGQIEHARAVAAWISLLKAEGRKELGRDLDVLWYDSVVVNGQLAWQDTLNAFNLPFFLSSDGIFTNYTWRPHVPEKLVEYLSQLRTLKVPGTEGKDEKDIWVGIDVWGRGSHGGGGFGMFKALEHVYPHTPSASSQQNLSIALFGQAWTWESEQDEPQWDWHRWWARERALWLDAKHIRARGDSAVLIPEDERSKDCQHGPYKPLKSFFGLQRMPPDPKDLPFHTTYSPGVGKAWFVQGQKVKSGDWTDVGKQTSLGNLAEYEEATVIFSDAWNGGTCVQIGTAGTWDLHNLCVSPGTIYEAVFVFKSSGETTFSVCDVESKASEQLGHGWKRSKLQFTPAEFETGAIVQVTNTEQLLLGQLNICVADPPGTASTCRILWADFDKQSGQLSWEIASSLPPVPPASLFLLKPQTTQPFWPTASAAFIPGFAYFNIYKKALEKDPFPQRPANDDFIGTSEDGAGFRFSVAEGGGKRCRYYVQGVTERGEVFNWNRCAYVDVSN